MTDADRGEWAAFASQLVPLRGRAVPEAPLAVLPPIMILAEAAPAQAKPVKQSPAAQIAVGDNPGGLDKASWNRLRTGRLLPARTLDLHGRTAQHAYTALVAFLHSAHADRVRCVEVITGRGVGGTGVIRREFPLWLNQPNLRSLVLAASHPHAANSGSVRLLLRRHR